jgi:hypothetical protein
MSTTFCSGQGSNKHNVVPTCLKLQPSFYMPSVSRNLSFLFFPSPLLFGVEGGELCVVGSKWHAYIFIARVNSFPDSSTVKQVAVLVRRLQLNITCVH